MDRYGKTLADSSNWWSKKQNKSIWAQNVLGITIKIGDVVIPLNTRLVSKQGRGNTDKPSLFIVMMKEVLDFFDAETGHTPYPAEAFNCRFFQFRGVKYCRRRCSL